MNKLLERQIKKVFGGVEKIPPGLEGFLMVVNEAYNAGDDDRALIERSLEISSKELGQLNEKLRVESESMKKNVNELERMNKLMIDRELKMIELKKEVEMLKAKGGGSVTPSVFLSVYRDAGSPKQTEKGNTQTGTFEHVSFQISR